ncbi:MAG TPA: hypothetical protein VL069_01515, partial [Opitutus sp.]|nr:hypothetical protein [Opitutus sp.]
RERPADGRVEVRHGELVSITIAGGRGGSDGAAYQFRGDGVATMALRIGKAHLGPGGGATIVTIGSGTDGFSFFVRDVINTFPIFLPNRGVSVSMADDTRSYQEIAAGLSRRHTLTKLQQIDAEAETDFESSSRVTRDQRAPTWLGLGRDSRLFKITHALVGNGLEQDVIRITRGSTAMPLPELRSKLAVYSYAEGRGQSVIVDVQRYLEDGALPILHKVNRDDDVHYHTTSFVSLETSPLRSDTVRGTHFLVADLDNAGNTLTSEQKALAARFKNENPDTEEVVLHLQVEATNTSDVPRYAYFKAPRPGAVWNDRSTYTFDAKTGFAQFSDDRVFCVSYLDGRPMPQEEMAVLLQPGEKATFHSRLPHQPIPQSRAAALAAQSFERRYAECRDYWRAKLVAAGRINVPEKRVNEMLQAGLLHLDLVTYGAEPNGTLAPSIGVYSPIGTESAPIILYYASVGLHDMARRSVMYFLEKQYPDGLIQNFSDYMVETGAALWVVGEYHRYTGDDAWIAEVKPKLLKSTEYLLNWRERNKLEALRHRGYGLLDGKVADPNDPYHQFMLNAYGYLGVSRIAEVLRTSDPVQSAALAREAAAWKEDIRDSLAYGMKHSPVVPLGDGSWSRTAPPWTETVGPRALYATGEKHFTHGTFNAADGLLGPMHLVFCEVLAPDEAVTGELLDYHTELFYRGNTAFSQPYYSRHDWVQLKRGMVKPFLETWYMAFSGLADRETYTFWEHVHHVSEHKTHEEAWFLMATRWMLFLEEDQTLKLLAGVPRKWLESGKSISLDRVSTYFGPLSLKVESRLQAHGIEAVVTCDSDRKPATVVLRLPHPDGKHPRVIDGGRYDPATESVTISPFTGRASVRLEY